MPLFEYQCTDCKADFEELVMSASQKISCPQCRSEKVEKKLSVFAASGGSSSSSSGCGNSSSGCGSGFS